MSNNSSDKNMPRSFVLHEPLLQKPEVVYTPSKHDPVFDGVSSEGCAENDKSSYEITEDQLLENLKGEYSALKIRKLDNIFVGDGIGDDFKRWESKNPIFVSAQTGSGKNHFIEHGLIEHVERLIDNDNMERKILILSNRIALNMQMKGRIEHSGVTKVLTYQGFESFIDFTKRLEKYKYVVCDESHFFTSDSMFNPNTKNILYKIISHFQHAVRIYMSSTFNDCLRCIFDMEAAKKHIVAEDKKGSVSVSPNFLYYQFKRNYSYLDIKYYSNHSELNKMIANSINSPKGKNEKWLIFIDNKKKCRDVKKSILSHAGNTLNKKDVLVINSGSKGEKAHNKLIKKARFRQKILISTSVIDNGININDDQLKHIVISDINKEKCIQMLGRKRINRDKAERITLYIRKFRKDELEGWITRLEEQQGAYRLYNLAYHNTSDPPDVTLNSKREFYNTYYNGDEHSFKDAKYWFYRDKNYPERVHPNEIAISLVNDVLLPRYRYICERMKETESGQEFLEQQLSWFGNHYNVENDITLQSTKNAIDKFDLYITSLHDRTVPKDEQKAFSLEFFQEHYNAYGLRKKESGYKADDNKSRVNKEGYGMDIIKDVFSVLHINMTIETNKEGAWELKKT